MDSVSTGMDADSPTITGIAAVAIPVTDQDRTKALFEDLGFETTFDVELAEGFRWIDMAVPGAATSLAVIASGEELPVGVDTGIRLLTPDARAARAAMIERGLDVDELLDWPTAPLMFSFRDLDGNRFYVAEES